MAKINKHALKLITACALLAIVICAPVGAELTGKDLVQALRAGGFNIYFRHAQTDWSNNDHVNAAGDWISCDSSRMRQLSEDGRRTSEAIGNAVRVLDIPISRVLASPYCRTVETATLMGLGPVDTTTDVMNLRAAAYFGGRAAIVRRAQIRLAEVPPAGTNIVLVAHGNVAREATPVYPSEAEAVIFRPDSSGSFEFVARLKPEQWKDLAKTSGLTTESY